MHATRVRIRIAPRHAFPVFAHAPTPAIAVHVGSQKSASGATSAPLAVGSARYGTSRAMYVPQFARAVRVPPGMNSVAIQMLPLSSATAAE